MLLQGSASELSGDQSPGLSDWMAVSSKLTDLGPTLPNDTRQVSEDEYFSNDDYSSLSELSGEAGDMAETSFLQSPGVLWDEPDPPPEKALSLACNVQSYDYPFYSEGRIMLDQDLSACLDSTNFAPSTSSRANEKAPERVLPFTHQASMPPNDHTVYQVLSSEDDIRLLEILPGLDGPLECRLHTARLPEVKDTYEALSYTWELKREVADSRVLCNGVHVAIGRNLANGLRKLRKANAPRMVWADALCINQSDAGERSHQVSRMSSIFENASQVIVWLGNEEYRDFHPQPPVHLRPAHLAFSAVCSIVNDWREIAQRIDTIPVARHSPGKTKLAATAQYGLLSPRSDLWDFVFRLYRCRWFSRLWVIQEVSLARAATVLWDDCDISWDWVGLAAAIIRTNFNKISGSTRGRQENKYMQAMPARRVPTGVTNAYFIYRLSRSQFNHTPLELSFLDLLRLTRHFGCKDARDRIYGLLGLPTADQIKSHIVPEYDKPVADIYHDAAKKIIESSNTLSLLSSVQRGRVGTGLQPGRNNFDIQLPSWVPQWNLLLTQSLSPFEPNPSSAASAGKALQLQDRSNTRILSVRGIIVDTIVSIGKYNSLDYYYRGSDKANRKRRVRAIRKQLKKSQRTRADLERIALTLTAGLTWYGLPVQDFAAHLADYASCLLRKGLLWSLEDDAWTTIPEPARCHANSCPVNEKSENIYVTFEDLEALSKGGKPDRFLDAATTVCVGRVRFSTDRGMTGLGPETMRPGDVVCVLYGADIPFVLRKDGEGCILVGECFIPGLMHGEAVHQLTQHPDLVQESWLEIH